MNSFLHSANRHLTKKMLPNFLRKVLWASELVLQSAKQFEAQWASESVTRSAKQFEAQWASESVTRAAKQFEAQ
jgi:hypothetical protein